MKYSIFLFSTILLFTSCSKSYYIRPDCAESQRTTYAKGIEQIVSEKKHIVMIGPKEIASDKLTMSILVKNTSDEELTLSINSIKALSSDKTLVRVFTYEELRSKLIKDKFMIELGNGPGPFD